MISVLASVSPATSLKLMPCPCFEATSTLMNLALRSLAWRKNKQCNVQLIHWHNGKIKHLSSLLAAPQPKTLSCRLWECKVESSWTIHTWKVIKRIMCLGWPLHIALTQETGGGGGGNNVLTNISVGLGSWIRLDKLRSRKNPAMAMIPKKMTGVQALEAEKDEPLPVLIHLPHYWSERRWKRMNHYLCWSTYHTK